MANMSNHGAASTRVRDERKSKWQTATVNIRWTAPRFHGVWITVSSYVRRAAFCLSEFDSICHFLCRTRHQYLHAAKKFSPFLLLLPLLSHPNTSLSLHISFCLPFSSNFNWLMLDKYFPAFLPPRQWWAKTHIPKIWNLRESIKLNGEILFKQEKKIVDKNVMLLCRLQYGTHRTTWNLFTADFTRLNQCNIRYRVPY